MKKFDSVAAAGGRRKRRSGSGGRSSSSDDEEKDFNLHEARCFTHRKKIGLPRLKKSTIIVDTFELKQDEQVRFITHNFTMKECIRFVPKSDQSRNVLGQQCYCGERLDNHYQWKLAMNQNNRLSNSLQRVGSMHRSNSSSPTRSYVLTPQVTEQLLMQQQLNHSHGSSPMSSIAVVGRPKSNATVVPTNLSPNLVAKGNGRNYDVFQLQQLDPNSLETAANQMTPRGGRDDRTQLLPSSLPPIRESRPRFTKTNTLPTIPGLRPNRPIIQVRDQSATVEDAGTGIKQEPEKWEPVECIAEFPTNAFGKVEFANDDWSSKPAKYIRVSDTTPVDKVIELMVKHWKMMEPNRANLVISVSGGAKNFRLDGKKREIFNRGLVKAAQATHAWIFTSGCYMGVARAVGEAVKEGQSLQFGQSRVTRTLRCIGVAPWGYVQSRDDLVSTSGKGLWPAVYLADPIIRHGQPVSIDPNHTHFLLVDDGHRNAFKGAVVADFRAHLEQRISAPASSTNDKAEKGLGIPVVVVLVEGGLDSVDNVYESVSKRIPVVICQGTGRAADILSYAFNHHRPDPSGISSERVIASDVKDIILKKLNAAFGKTMKGSELYRKEKFKEKLQLISKCCQNESMITVFDINRYEDLDLAILSALLKGQGASRIDQLKLALKWNRSDVASEKIFVDSAIWIPGELDDIMTESLATNKVDFVRLLLQHGIVMKDYLTMKRLRTLYNAASKTSHLRSLLKDISNHATFFTLRHVQMLLKVLLERTPENNAYALDSLDLMEREFGQQTYCDEVVNPISEARFEKPFKELFLWAVLMNRPELAKFFWERGDNAIVAAIAATKIFKALMDTVSEHDTTKIEEYGTLKVNFEELAIEVVHKAYNSDPEKALLIIEKQYPHWGNFNCLYLAAMALDRKFVATACAQASVQQTWKRGLNCSIVQLLFCFICPLYVICGLKFDSSAIGYETNELSWLQKGKIFYSAPITKFCSFTASYVLFLSLYTYTILFGLRIEMTYVEMVLHAIVGSILLENARTLLIIYIENKNGFSNCMTRSSIWQKIISLALFIHINGFILRWFDEHFEAARLLFSIAVILFYLSLFRVYVASSYLGPKLFVIKQMMNDVVMFMMILIVFMLSYAVSSQALIYPDRPFYWGVFKEILYHPYWQIYGELNLDQTIGGEWPGCDGNVTFNDEGQYCPRKYWPVALILAAYLLVGNVLLINLLIAIFSHIFEEVQANSLTIWKFEMWSLVEEFDDKPLLPPPFLIIELLYRFFKWAIFMKLKLMDDNVIPLTQKQKENLKIFEKDSLNEYLHSVQQIKSAEIGSRVKWIQETLDNVSKDIEEDRCNHKDQTLFSRIGSERHHSIFELAKSESKEISTQCEIRQETPVKEITLEKIVEEPQEIQHLEITEDYKLVQATDVAQPAPASGEKEKKRRKHHHSTRKELRFMHERVNKLENDNQQYLDMIQRLEKLLASKTQETVEKSSSSDEDNVSL